MLSGHNLGWLLQVMTGLSSIAVCAGVMNSVILAVNQSDFLWLDDCRLKL